MAIYHIGKYTGIYHTLKRAGKGHIGNIHIHIIYAHYKACEDYPCEPPKLSANIKCTIFSIL